MEYTHRQKTGGREIGTPNKKNAFLRDRMRLYVTSEFEHIIAHLHELTLSERLIFFRTMVRYGIAPLSPEVESADGEAPVVVVISDTI